MENEPRWLKPFHYSRLYNFAPDFDNDTNRDESRVRFNMLHYGFYSKEKGKYIFNIDTLQNINNGNIWFSIRGVSKWMSDLGFTDKDRPLNLPLMNTEDPASYSRHAEIQFAHAQQAAVHARPAVICRIRALRARPQPSIKKRSVQFVLAFGLDQPNNRLGGVQK
jgi:hypothetical protein